RWLRQLSFSMGVCCSRQHQGRPSEICLWEEVELFHHECVAMRYRFIILFAMAWLTVAPGKAQPGEAVKPEHRVCQRDADCQLVEVPCTCGQTKLAVNVQHSKNYARQANCTKAEISHCAQAGASVARSAVCKVGQCAVVIKTSPSSE